MKIEDWRKKYIDRLAFAADELLKEETPAISEKLWEIFETTGERLSFERVYFARRKRLSVFSSLCIEGIAGDDIAEKLNAIIMDICKEVSWALPAHVNRKIEGWETTVDLFSCETAEALSEIAFSLRDVLPDDVKNSIITEVMRRVMRPFTDRRPYADWEQSSMNWNAVCNGSIGMAAIYLLRLQGTLIVPKDRIMLERLIERTRVNIAFYPDGFSDEGVCFEGMGYYTYAMTFFCAYEKLLREYMSEWHNKSLAEDLLKNEKVKRMAAFQKACYFPNGKTVCFSDSDENERFRVGLACFFEDEYGGAMFPPMISAAEYDSDDCYRFMMINRDLCWSAEYLKKRGKSENFGRETCRGNEDTREITGGVYVFPKAQWLICHGRKGGVFAIKGGHNDEPHNHNDIGSFIYIKEGRTYFADIGAGEYTADYFGEGRYGILNNSSEGHNVPLVDGHLQKAGREHCCDMFSVRVYTADGKSSKISSLKSISESEVSVVELEMSIGQAYADDVVLIRKCRYNLDTELFELTDTCNYPITENFVTREKTEEILTESGIVCRIGTENVTLTGERKVRIIHNHKGFDEEVRIFKAGI